LVIWLADLSDSVRHVWSLDLEGVHWHRREFISDPEQSMPDKGRFAGWAARSGVRGPVVGLYRVESNHFLVVGREVFDLSLLTVVEHLHHGPCSRLVVRQGARTARAWRFEGWLLPDYVPLFREPMMYLDDEPVWQNFQFHFVARDANSPADATAGPQDYLMDWSPWVKD
jgi:hypothetical protein